MKVGLVLNGDIPSKIEDDDFIVCSDGGYDRLKEIGVEPDILLGDMDSIKEKPDRDIIYYPPEKDATDGELALDYCLTKDPDTIHFYGVFGGRPDHVEGNYCLMYKAFLKGINVVALSKEYTMYLADKPITLENVKGKTLSVVPLLDKVHVTNEEGLQYPMDDLTITKNSSRGISNVCLEDKITINIFKGVAMIFVINDIIEK